MSSTVVLGVNGCIDHEVEWDTARLQEIVDDVSLTVDDIDEEVPVRDVRTLLASLLGHMRRGGGGEKAIQDGDILTQVVQMLPGKTSLGGTGARAAAVLSALRVPCLVHLASSSRSLRGMLPHGVSYLCGSTRDDARELPHLVFQYPSGVRIHLADGKYVQSPGPNRVIYADTEIGQRLEIHPDLPARCVEADVFLVSGLNMMVDEKLVKQRLKDIEDCSAKVKPGGLVIFEEGGYHLAAIRDYVGAHSGEVAELHSMSAEELQERAIWPIDLDDATDVVRAARIVREQRGCANLMVHSARWALILGPRSRELRGPLRNAIDVASARFVHGDAVTTAAVSTVTQGQKSPDMIAFCRVVETQATDIVCEPGYDLSPSCPTTIGLGDAFLGGFIYGFSRKNRESRAAEWS